ncbi:MAG TPA: crotonobetainyl-CoA--carnitine CoA-transferase [Bacteroidia bacterium]|nr:crotonobetainyl-CoA--carnitine CoA-transferase [Bacteroidia bacterium]
MSNEKSDSELIKKMNEKDFNSRMSLTDLMFNAPIPKEELMNNIALFIDRRILSRILFFDEMYAHIKDLHGSIIEFGTRYGPNLALLTSLRGIYEPYNHNRKIIAFDTFSGFPEVDAKDKNSKLNWVAGDYGVPENYENFLAKVLSEHESISPISNIKKFELVKGDVNKTVDHYFENRQESIIAMAYFDFDIYKPTKKCLETIVPYLTRGAVLGFDEINVQEWPGETMALREVLGTKNFRIRQSVHRANAGYIIFE